MIIDIRHISKAVASSCAVSWRYAARRKCCNVQKCCQLTKQLENVNSVAPEPWGPKGHVPPSHFAIARVTGGSICSCTSGKTSNWRQIIL